MSHLVDAIRYAYTGRMPVDYQRDWGAYGREAMAQVPQGLEHAFIDWVGASIENQTEYMRDFVTAIGKFRKWHRERFPSVIRLPEGI